MYNVYVCFLVSDGVELSRQAIKLIEENLRLRTLLLGHKDSQSKSSGDESQKPESSKEQEDVGTTAGKEIEEEIMESEREVPPALISSSSSSQAGSSSASGRDEKENEDVQQEGGEAVDNASKEVVARGSAEEQPWPISSLLSDDSRNGSKDHNLPILSPTYIAEHCSTTSCEAHFFPPPVSSLPRASNLSNVGTSRSTSLCSHVGPTTETLTADGGPSTTVPPRSILYSSSVSHVTPHPPTPPYPSPTTRQSIVQPWIGGPISRNENTVIQSSVIMQPSPLQSTVPETGRWPVHRAQLRGCQHSVASMVRYTNHRQHMYNPRPSHSARSRVGLRTQYTSTGEQYITDESAPTRVYTHREGRGHCSEVHSSYPTTGSSFQLCAGSVNPSMSPSFPNPSTDICFHHSVQPMHSPALPPPLTQHNSHSLNIGHHPHPHQHNYPLPPHPHPSFTSHPHHPPSHHSTVWRPYSDRQRTATRFSLSDILSPSLTSTPTLGLPTPVSPLVHQSPGGRTPSFFVDHLLDDL